MPSSQGRLNAANWLSFEDDKTIRNHNGAIVGNWKNLGMRQGQGTECKLTNGEVYWSTSRSRLEAHLNEHKQLK